MRAQRSTPETKLAAFLRMLTSDRAGEVDAALGKITKLLKSPVGLDLHAVADRVENIAPPPTNPQIDALYNHAYAKGAADENRRLTAEMRLPTRIRDVDTDEEASRWHTLVVFCSENLERARVVYEREPGFVEAMLIKTADGDVPSEKEQTWLRKIFRRCGGQL